nr:hypothetical protein Iba_chr07aCG14110 [Ipomoea batatas]
MSVSIDDADKSRKSYLTNIIADDGIGIARVAIGIILAAIAIFMYENGQQATTGLLTVHQEEDEAEHHVAVELERHHNCSTEAEGVETYIYFCQPMQMGIG